MGEEAERPEKEALDYYRKIEEEEKRRSTSESSTPTRTARSPWPSCRQGMDSTPTKTARSPRRGLSFSLATRRALTSTVSRTAASLSSSPTLTSRRSRPLLRMMTALFLHLRNLIRQTTP